MNNYQLICKEGSLTEKEYYQLWNSLLVDDTVKINFHYKIPLIYKYIDKIRIKLKYLSKSAKFMASWCMQQFKYSRILLLDDMKGEKYNEMLCDTTPPSYFSYIPIIGANCHMINDKVWDILDVDMLLSYKYVEDISNHIFNKCILFIPKEEIAKSVYHHFLRQYSDYEANRIAEIINVKGKISGRKYVKPLYRELKIENPSLGKSGIVDSILLLLDDSIGINDYKYGKPHYYYGSKLDKLNIEIEIGEYFSLLQGDAYKVLNEHKMVPLEFLGVDKGRILYLKDWKGTYDFIKITPDMIQKEQNLELDIIEAINTGKFPRRKTIHCIQNCDYFRICERSYEWSKKWKEVDDLIKIEDFML